MFLDSEDLAETTLGWTHWCDIDDCGIASELWQDMDNGMVYILVRNDLGGTVSLFQKDFIRRNMLTGVYPPLPRDASKSTAKEMKYLLVHDERRKDKQVYGCYSLELKNRQSVRDMSCDIQDKLAGMGLIALVNPRVGTKGGNIIGYRVLNKYLTLDRYIEDITDLDWVLDVVSGQEPNISEANYYCWCKCLAQRPEWKKDERYKHWSDRYTLYRLDKLFAV